MMKKVTILIILFWPVIGCAFEDPHQLSHIFRQNHRGLTAPVCLVCHRSAEPAIENGPLLPIENDQRLCLECHKNSDQQSINHPVGMSYDPEIFSGRYVRNPQGVKLFQSGEQQSLKIMCSTCHDPHGNQQWLLRLPLENSKLCLSCHNYR